MKAIATFLFLIFATASQAANHWCDSQNGVNSGAAAGGTQATPYKTVTYAKTYMNPGDTLFLKRGLNYDVALFISGTGGWTISAYGTGAPPTFSGAVTATGWTLVSGNVYKWNYPSTGGADTMPFVLNIVKLNGKQVAPGRWPKTGWRPYQAWTNAPNHYFGEGSITDNNLTADLPAGWNITGSEMVQHQRNWVFNRFAVQSVSGGTITYGAGYGQLRSNYPNFQAGYGYFLQQDMDFCNQKGDYFWEISTKTLYMNFGGESPAANLVTVSRYDQAALLAAPNITFWGLQFQDFNRFGITSTTNGNTTTVDSCYFTAIGEAGIYQADMSRPRILRSVFWEMPNDAIKITRISENTVGGKYGEVGWCQFTNIGMTPGLGQSMGNAYIAILFFADSANIHHNRIKNTGYNAITFQGRWTFVEKNWIDSSNCLLGDGAPIYTIGAHFVTSNGVTNVISYNPADTTTSYIQDNIITNAWGNNGGVAGSAYEAGAGLRPNDGRKSFGIYLDEKVQRHIVRRNFISGVATAGVFFHNGYYNQAENNTVVNAWRVYREITYTNTGNSNNKTDTVINGVSQLPSGLTWQNNLAVISDGDKYVLAEINHAYNGALEFTQMAGNTYYHPNPATDTLYVTHKGASANLVWSGLPAFKSLYSGGEIGSQVRPYSGYLAFANPSDATVNKAIPGTFSDKDGNTYTNTIAIGPWSSVVLFPAAAAQRIAIKGGKIALTNGKISLTQNSLPQ